MRTFLDSGVLLAAWRGDSLAAPALALLGDDARVFVTSQLVRLELLPKTIVREAPARGALL